MLQRRKKEQDNNSTTGSSNGSLLLHLNVIIGSIIGTPSPEALALSLTFFFERWEPDDQHERGTGEENVHLDFRRYPQYHPQVPISIQAGIKKPWLKS